MFQFSPPRRSAPSLRITLLGALAIGLGAGALSFLLYPLSHGADFAQFHYHARVWLSGRDPYDGGFPIMRATHVVPEPLFYPLPTVLAVAPFALLPLRVGAATFVTISTALLAFGIIRRSPERLPLFLGAGFFVAVGLGQWSPLVCAAFVLPAIAWLAVLKPNLGLATTVASASVVGAIGGAVLLVASLVLQPNWPREWLRNLHAMPGHPAPILVPGGVLLFAALLRWRRPEARLIAAMACVPQLLYFADQLPLWFVPKTRRESMLLSASSLIAWTVALEWAGRTERQPAFSSTWFVMAGVYVPALLMVLRRPNEGPVPHWLEPVMARMPAALRGQPSSAPAPGDEKSGVLEAVDLR